MHHTHASLKRQGNRDHAAKLKRMSHGGATEAAAAVHKHEKNMHPGRKPTKMKDGGAVMGEHAKPRLDRPGRAKGGKTKGGGKTHVNVIVGAPGGAQHPPMPMPVPVAGGPPRPPAAPSPVPPPAAAPGGPPGMPPRPPMGPPVAAGVPGMGMRARGGRAGYAEGGKVGPDENKGLSANMEENHTKVSDEPGSGSGLGRLDKIEDYGTKAVGEGRKALKRGGMACD